MERDLSKTASTEVIPQDADFCRIISVKISAGIQPVLKTNRAGSFAKNPYFLYIFGILTRTVFFMMSP